MTCYLPMAAGVLLALVSAVSRPAGLAGEWWLIGTVTGALVAGVGAGIYWKEGQ